ncbi:hypothetical protein C8Q74DRAFT_1302774 [Fomes fomentarius]|nr:hypothetical protein C8Q74DRAFT_1302774 [Fomes fomentarius]
MIRRHRPVPPPPVDPTSCSYLRLCVRGCTSDPALRPRPFPSRSSDAPVKVITVEILRGEREELYWNKMPQRVRREAVWNAIAQMVGGGAGEVVKVKTRLGMRRKKMNRKRKREETPEARGKAA